MVLCVGVGSVVAYLAGIRTSASFEMKVTVDHTVRSETMWFWNGNNRESEGLTSMT